MHTSIYGSALLMILIAGCGDDGSSDLVDAAPARFDAMADSPDATSVDAQIGAFTLTSMTITEGNPIPPKHSCDGDDVSPQLSWSDPPTGTMSLAIVFNDVSLPFLHSVAWDIPVVRTSLQEDVANVFQPFGAGDMKQARAWNGQIGYAGPCPNPGPNMYQFTLHAIPTAVLGGVDQNSSRAAVRSAVEAASIGSVNLNATYTRQQ